jgi:chromosome segregation ATPase
MRERERLLLEANDRLSRENHNLKVNLDITEQDLRHHRAALAQANANVRDLAVENGNLRRSLEAYHNIEERHHNKTKELRNRITRLENETETLRARIRELTGNLRDAVDARVRALTKEVAEWRRRWESLDKVYTKLSGNLDYYIKKSSDLSEENVILRRESESYERILRRHRLI